MSSQKIPYRKCQVTVFDISPCNFGGAIIQHGIGRGNICKSKAVANLEAQTITELITCNKIKSGIKWLMVAILKRLAKGVLFFMFEPDFGSHVKGLPILVSAAGPDFSSEAVSDIWTGARSEERRVGKE